MKNYRILMINTHTGKKTLTAEVYDTKSLAENEALKVNKSKKPITALVLENTARLPKTAYDFE